MFAKYALLSCRNSKGMVGFLNLTRQQCPISSTEHKPVIPDGIAINHSIKTSVQISSFYSTTPSWRNSVLDKAHAHMWTHVGSTHRIRFRMISMKPANAALQKWWPWVAHIMYAFSLMNPMTFSKHHKQHVTMHAIAFTSGFSLNCFVLCLYVCMWISMCVCISLSLSLSQYIYIYIYIYWKSLLAEWYDTCHGFE
jgi:hypothetical protein